MNKENLETRLLAAAEAGELAEVRSLLDQGASVNAKDECGWTALQLAIGEGFSEIVELLLRHGAEPRSVDNDGWRPRGSSGSRPEPWPTDGPA